jgi:hypothetical protein
VQLDTVTYPDARVTEFVSRNFVGTKVDFPNAPEAAKRLRVSWTPTILVLDPEGTEHHRFVGFLPPPDYLAQVTLGLGKSELDRGNHGAAAERFAAVVSGYPESEAAPEALYFLGVAKYRQTKDPSHLKTEWTKLREKYGSSEWAKKVGFAVSK